MSKRGTTIPTPELIIAEILRTSYRFVVAYPNSIDDTVAMDAAGIVDALSDAGYVVIDRNRAQRMHALLGELSDAGYRGLLNDDVRDVIGLYAERDDLFEAAWGLTNDD